MFKNEIKFITDLNSAKIKNYSGFLSLRDIKKSKIHNAVLKYVLAEIEQQLYNDRLKLVNNSIFEYNDDRIHNYLNLISENIKRTNRFKFEFLSNLIQDSVIFNIHFLIAPNKTLTQFVFGNTNKKTADEINLSLSHIYYYKYFRKIIPAYLERKNKHSITRAEFIGLLKKIDKISTKSHLTDTINTAINSIANFFKGAVPNEVPIQAIYLFLQGKQLTSHYKVIQSEFLDKSISSASIQDIKNILATVVSEEEVVLNSNSDNEKKLFEENSIDNVQNKDTDILDIEENENHIPNEDLISSETEINGNTIFNEHNLTEETTSEKNKTTILEEPKEEANIENITEESINTETETQKLSAPEKPDPQETLASLIDIDKLYDSILPSNQVSEDSKLELTDSNTYMESIKDKIDYKLDESTLEKSLANGNTLNEDDVNLAQFQSVYEPPMELKDSTKGKEDLFVEEKILEKTEEKIKEVDEYINESKIEDNLITETTENITDEHQNIQQLSDGEKDITLSESNDEEMTEVFSDLTYLDKEDIEDAPEEEALTENIEVKNETEFETIPEENELLTNDNDDEILTKTEIISDTQTSAAKVSTSSSISFKDMVSSEDMSQTIEIIFDYDMEDYQRILNAISESKTEQDAIGIIDNYCEQNYINTTYAEVEKFKSLISNYFLQR